MNAPKKLYYLCNTCGYYSRFRETYAPAKNAFALFTGLLFGFLVMARFRDNIYCLHCGEKKLTKVFLDTPPSPLIEQEEPEKKLRYVRCAFDGEEIRYPLGAKMPTCSNGHGRDAFKVFYRAEKGQ